MPWPVRSRQLVLAAPVLVLNVPIVVGTVPVGKTWLIKDWTLFNNIGGARTFYWIVLSGAAQFVLHAELVGGGAIGRAPRQLDWVLKAGDQLQLQGNVAGSVQTAVFGAELG